jgi:hypothetical protein
MASCLGPQFARKEGGVRRRYTGRHWWGRRAGDGLVEPIVGAKADQIAEALGMPRYDHGSRGTTVLVVAPDFDQDEPGPLLAPALSTLLRDFWPKLMDGPGGAPTMLFNLCCDGQMLDVPDPEQVPVLAGFARAFRALVRANGSEAHIRTIQCRSPIQDLGQLAVLRFPCPVDAASPIHRKFVQEDGPFGEACRHVALLRAPNFVVKYVPGPPVPFDQVAYAGVFKALEEVDHVFASAEPPTHDDWIPDMLDRRRDRTFVRTAFVRIGEALRTFVAPPEAAEAEPEELPLGAFSHALGGLIPGEPGIGASLPAGSTSGVGGASAGAGAGSRWTGAATPNAGQRRVKVQATGPTGIEVIARQPALLVHYEVEGPEGALAKVGAEGSVVIEGSALEKEPPAGAERPRVLEWRDATGRTLAWAPERTVRLDGGKASGAVAVSVPPDSMIRVRLTVRLEADHG